MRLVKILSDDSGNTRSKEDQVWHLVENVCGSNATFCEGEFFGKGESGCDFITKDIKRGGITCPKCMERLRWCKNIKL